MLCTQSFPEDLRSSNTVTSFKFLTSAAHLHISIISIKEDLTSAMNTAIALFSLAALAAAAPAGFPSSLTESSGFSVFPYDPNSSISRGRSIADCFCSHTQDRDRLPIRCLPDWRLPLSLRRLPPPSWDRLVLRRSCANGFLSRGCLQLNLSSRRRG